MQKRRDSGVNQMKFAMLLWGYEEPTVKVLKKSYLSIAKA